MAIGHSVRENRLRDTSSVTAADCAAFIDGAEMWDGWRMAGYLGFSADYPRDGSIWALSR